MKKGDRVRVVNPEGGWEEEKGNVYTLDERMSDGAGGCAWSVKEGGVNWLEREIEVIERSLEDRILRA